MTLKIPSRRGFLKGTALAGAALATPTFFIRGAYAQTGFCNEPTGSEVVFGFNVPQTGAYAEEGKDELRAFELAVKHLNGEGDGGMLTTLNPNNLKGNGVLGKKVTYVTGDSQTKADAARASARRMIEKDKVIMWSGGSSSAEAVAQQALAQEMGVIFMCGLTHANDTTGKDRRRYGFRHFFNCYITGEALGPVIAEELGTDRRAYHLTADYNWGWSQQESIKNATEKLGWETVAAVLTPLGAGDFSQYLTPVLNSGADVLILNHYGNDMVNSLTQAVQFGMRDKQVNGKQFEVVVPLYSELMAEGAGDAVKGVLGTSNWSWKLEDPGTQAFVKAFGQAYGRPPSQAAHTCYVQTLLYADAVERAGTFYPPEVIKALEDHTFDGTGNGPTLYRAGDHQCFHDVLVQRGKATPDNQFDLLEIVKRVPRADIEYPVDLFEGELGPAEVNGCSA
jgi:branched-chain amino acid transport system substrate-binding protein